MMRIHFGMITGASVTEPDQPANILYAAATIDLDPLSPVINVPFSTPVGGRPLLASQAVQADLIPAKVNDPCLIIEGAADQPGIVVLTEVIDWQPCPTETPTP